MGRIEEKFQSLKEDKEKALIIYLTAGDPDMDTSLELFTCAALSGADILEIGIPFSDPMADGPIIQRGFSRSLTQGTNVKGVLSLVKELRKYVDIPIVLFGYVNPIIAYSPGKFFRDAKKAGADGVLVVDLPREEWEPYRYKALGEGLDWIGLVAPTSGKERIGFISRDSSGFVYVISVTGITGARKELPLEYMKTVRMVRDSVSTPVVVGFGISTPKMAEKISRTCDGVVIGSACVRMIEKWGGQNELLLSKLSEFIGNTKKRLMNADI